MPNKQKIVFLSYSLSEATPLYGNGTGISFSNDKEITKGDSCNTMNLSFSNHSGTHIDLPYHFDKSGKTINDYSADFWEFNNVEIIDLSNRVSECEIIDSKKIPEIKNPDADLILIKTGFSFFRGSDKYTLTPPGLSSKLAKYFRINYPKIRCVGMDLISISSYSNREEGRKAHIEFLNPSKGDPILLIEDMKLDIDQSFDKVVVAPLQIDGADGVPCTILGYYK